MSKPQVPNGPTTTDDDDLPGGEPMGELDGPMARLLPELTREMKARGAPRVDLDKLEEELFAKIDAGEGPRLPLVASAPKKPVRPAARPSRAMPVVAAVLALAAGFLVWARFHGESPAVVPAPGPVAVVEPANAARGVDLGEPVSAGESSARFERPGLAAWVLEPKTKARVKQLPEKIELSLDEGAVWVDVVPQPVPERFVVVAGKTRVAVRGTRFRVARVSDRVEVDVDHGTVAVSPLEGGREPQLVKGPAGGTFPADGAAGQLRELHPFGEQAAAPGATAARVADGERHPAAVEPRAPAPRASAPQAAAKGSEPQAKGSEPAPAADEPTLRARASVVAADCFQGKAPVGQGNMVTVETTLTLEVDPAGKVTSFSFSPSLESSVEQCFLGSMPTLRGPAGRLVMPLQLMRRR